MSKETDGSFSLSMEKVCEGENMVLGLVICTWKGFNVSRYY